ncbi:MAG: hypothetical protein RL189_1759 [Pseudomonadota bacterium]|jgi:hypothetical protein
MKQSENLLCSSIALACVALTACGSKNNASNSPAPENKDSQIAQPLAQTPQSNSQSETPPAQETPTVAQPVANPDSPAVPVDEPKFEMPQVKYPAAVIFEGGKGDPWYDTDGTKHVPHWRLYLCLKKSDTPIQEQVTLDLAKLGNPIEVSATSSTTKEILWTERLTSLVLNYTYTTQLFDDPDHNFGYAYGKANFESSSIQNWSLVYQAPGYTKGQHKSDEDIDLFNFVTRTGFLFSQSTYLDRVNNENYYVSSQLDRFTFSRNYKQVHVIEDCETQDKPYFFQMADEITIK